MSAHFNIFSSFGFGIDFYRNKSIFSVSVTGSVEKKNGCFGRNEKKPFGCTLLMLNILTRHLVAYPYVLTNT